MTQIYYVDQELTSFGFRMLKFVVKFTTGKTLLVIALCLAVALPPVSAEAKRLEGSDAERIVERGTIIGATALSVVAWDLLVKFGGKFYGCRLVVSGPNTGVPFCVSD